MPTRPTTPIPSGRFHPGCGVVPAALATGEPPGRSGHDLLRAVTLAYDVGARSIYALGVGALYTEQHSTLSLTTTFGAAAAAAAMLRLDPRQVRHTFSFAAQQASGVGFLGARPRACREGVRFRRHGGAQRRHGGHHGGGPASPASTIRSAARQNIFTALGGDKPAPEKLIAELGKRYEIIEHHDQEMVRRLAAAVGARLRRGAARDPAVRADHIKRIGVDMPADRLHIVDNSTIPDICLQHLVALMIVDGGASFDSVHDFARMSDPKVLAVRKLVEAVPNQELVTAVPARQAIVRIDTADGRTLSHRT